MESACVQWNGVVILFQLFTSTGAEFYYSAGSERSKFLEQPVNSACPRARAKTPHETGQVWRVKSQKLEQILTCRPRLRSFGSISIKYGKNFFRFFGAKTPYFSFLGPYYWKTRAGIEKRTMGRKTWLQELMLYQFLSFYEFLNILIFQVKKSVTSCHASVTAGSGRAGRAGPGRFIT